MWLVVVPALGVLVRAVLRARMPPPNRPARRRGCGGVVCLGESTVQGNVSYDFVADLIRRRPDRAFVNAGVNGDTSAQVLARVPEVMACRPSHVVVLVGANDLFAILGTRLSAGRRTTLTEYRTNLTAIVRGLHGARVALMSIQPLGEQLDSHWNVAVDGLNEVVRTVACEEGATYLPLNERMRELLQGADKPFHDSIGRVLLAMFLRLGLGMNVDRIAHWYGYRIHTEGLHLAGPAGRLAADLTEEFPQR